MDCEDCKDLNPRCADETLKELGITKFTRVFIVEEVNLSDKDKRYLKNRNKNTIVRFLPSSSASIPSADIMDDCPKC